MPETQSNAWICTICGYIHYGPEPPDYCPVCGAESEQFESYTEPSPKRENVKPAQWRCLICEYIHDGPDSPESCPVCGAPSTQFEPHAVESAPVTHNKSARRIIIAGAGIAGVSAAEAVRKISPRAEIVLLSKEADLPYYRLNLTRYLAGEIPAEALDLHPPEWYTERGVELLLGTELLSIDLEKKSAAASGGRLYDFDRLILTAGSHPFMPPLPGVNRENVTALRSRKDAEVIRASCQKGMRCVCIGGGILGLETAGALALQGVDVTLLEGFGWLLPRQLNKRAGELLEAYVTSTGVSLRKQAQTQELIGDERVRGVQLQDGTSIPADFVIITTGVRSNSYPARMTGLKVNQGINVDDRLTTSHPDVYAAGDVAEHRSVMYGLWGPAQYQGTIAGMNAAGKEAEFAGIPRANMLKVLGYNMFSIGQITIDDASFSCVEDESDGMYACFIFRDNYLAGSILLGDTSMSAAVKKAVENRCDCSKILQRKPDAKKVIDFIRNL